MSLSKTVKYALALVLLFFLIPPWTLLIEAKATSRSQSSITKDEAREARKIALEFSERLLKTGDLAPIVKDLYLDDFVERYLRFQTRRTAQHSLSYFDFAGIPAITFKPALLSHPKDELWPRFYIAANDLYYFGLLSIVAKNKSSNLDVDSVKGSDIYPSSVATLLNKNPTLANFIEKKGRYVDVSTPEELRDVTVTLERAVIMMRDYLDKESPLNNARIDENIAEARKDPNSIKLSVDVTEEEFFGVPKGSRIIRTDSPAGFQLMLVKVDTQLKILWANIETGD